MAFVASGLSWWFMTRDIYFPSLSLLVVEATERKKPPRTFTVFLFIVWHLTTHAPPTEALWKKEQQLSVGQVKFKINKIFLNAWLFPHLALKMANQETLSLSNPEDEEEFGDSARNA